jgi:hypothetical protein
LVADLQAHLGFALETAAFLRAGEPHHAKDLEGALNTGVWGHLHPAAKRLYEKLRDHYRLLKVDLTATQTKAWAGEAVALLGDVLRHKNLPVRLNIVPRRAGPKRPQRARSGPAARHESILDPDGGLP